MHEHVTVTQTLNEHILDGSVEKSLTKSNLLSKIVIDRFYDKTCVYFADKLITK